MAQFRGTIQGFRGPASRLGSKDSGLQVTANGWNVGVSLDAMHVDGHDEIRVYLTGGSNGHGSSKLLGTWEETKKGNVWNGRR
jgi:hypothetical protein